MKTFALLALLTTSFIVYEEANYKIDFEKVKISFYFPSDDLKGTIEGFKGEIHFDITDLASSHIEGTVDVLKLNTNNEQRDTHLKQDDLFDAVKYPTMTFKSTGIEKTEEGIVVTGNLGIKGVSKEEKIMMEYKDGIFIGKTTIFITDYGVKIGKTRKKNQVDITFSIPATAE